MKLHLAALLTLAVLPGAAQAQHDRMDWKQCIVEYMPETAKLFVENNDHYYDMRKLFRQKKSDAMPVYGPRFHDTRTALEVGCGYILQQHGGNRDIGYFRSGLLFKYLKKNQNLLSGVDKIRPSTRLYELLDNRSGSEAVVGTKTYVYINGTLVSVVFLPGPHSGQKLPLYIPTGGETERLIRSWPEESIDDVINGPPPSRKITNNDIPATSRNSVKAGSGQEREEETNA